MRFLIAAAIALVTAFALTQPLKKAPLVFYGIALAMDALYAWCIATGTVAGSWALFVTFMRQCTLAMAFLAIVMFTGVLSNGSAVKAKLVSIRRQLSIIGCILAMAHVVNYINSYVASVFVVTHRTFVLMSLTVSIAVTLLMVVLMVTSFTFVRSRMKPETWKQIQKLSYLFWGLIYVHMLFILKTPLFAGASTAMLSVAVYTVLFGTYFALRWRRHKLDSAEEGAESLELDPTAV